MRKMGFYDITACGPDFCVTFPAPFWMICVEWCAVAMLAAAVISIPFIVVSARREQKQEILSRVKGR